MKNYYFILSLSTQASDLQIKQAYRRLALQFHPDKNPSPEAEAIFKEVNEAYEVLGDPLRKAIYDQMLRGGGEEAPPVAPAPQRPHRDPRYRPQPKNAPRKPSKREELLALMATHLRHAQLVSRLTLLFSVILIADYSLPSKKISTHIVGEQATNRGSSFKIELGDGNSVSISREAARKIGGGKNVMVYQSALFSIPVSLEDQRTHFRSPVEISIYGNFAFGPLILLITSLLGTFYWKGVEFRFNLGIVNFLLLLLNLVFLQIHKF
ncbi:MAG: DnaJ domain-containing protein [Bacteroidetes bacterium]|nr:DnaJ domain-containing protein [Bacteroidota bacterium]